MKLAPVLFCLLLAGMAVAQDKGPVLKLNPLALIDDPGFPTVSAGIESHLGNKWSWYNEAGIKYRRSIVENHDSSFMGTGGFKLKTEFRYYLRDHQAPYGLYAGGHFFLNQDKHHTAVMYTRPGETQERYDVFAVKKRVAGMSFVFGSQKLSAGGLVTDFYAGLGFRYRHYDVSNLEYNYLVDTTHMGPDYTFGADRIYAEAERRNGFITHFVIGLRLGFQPGKKD